MGQPLSSEDLDDIEENLTGKSLFVGAILCSALCVGMRFYMHLTGWA